MCKNIEVHLAFNVFLVFSVKVGGTFMIRQLIMNVKNAVFHFTLLDWVNVAHHLMTTVICIRSFSTPKPVLWFCLAWVYYIRGQWNSTLSFSYLCLNHNCIYASLASYQTPGTGFSVLRVLRVKCSYIKIPSIVSFY